MQLIAKIIEMTIGVLSCIATLVATYFAWQTVKCAKRTIELQKQQDEPDVVVYLTQQINKLNNVIFVVKNEGKKSAYDIQFEIDDKIELWDKRKITDVSFIKNGIQLLTGYGEINQNFFILLDEQQYEQIQHMIFTVSVSYRDGNGRHYFKNINCSLQGHIDRQVLPKDYLKETNKNLKEIGKFIKKIALDK